MLLSDLQPSGHWDIGKQILKTWTVVIKVRGRIHFREDEAQRMRMEYPLERKYITNVMLDRKTVESLPFEIFKICLG